MLPCFGTVVYLELRTRLLSSSRSSGMTFAQLFLYFAKSNSSHTLVDLIFLLILSIRMTLILSYPSLHVPYLTFFVFPSKCTGYFMTSYRNKDKKYLLVSRRAVFLGQLEGDLSPDQLVGQLLDLLLDGHKSTRHMSGHGIFKTFISRPIRHSFLLYFPFHLVNISLTTFMTSRLMNKNGFID